MAEIIMLNRSLPPDSIQLDTRDFLPHISLAMGVLESEQLGNANEILKNISNRQPVDVRLNDTDIHTPPNGVVMSGLEAEKSAELVKLHLDVMEAMRPLLTHDNVTTDMFNSPPEVAEVSTHWVKHYYDKKSADDFHPHVTLGRGELSTLGEPITFCSDRLAICHLGTYCTCRKVLVEAQLRAS